MSSQREEYSKFKIFSVVKKIKPDVMFTNTSPVLKSAWVERELLGLEITLFKIKKVYNETWFMEVFNDNTNKPLKVKCEDWEFVRYE